MKKGDVVGEHWRIVDHKPILGHGGNATVYKAENQETGEEVAIKHITKTLSKKEENRLKTEIEIQSHVANELHNCALNVIAYSMGTSDSNEENYIVMPIAKTAVEVLGLEPKLEEVIEMALQIAQKILLIRQKIPGFLHRDIKPENIFFFNGEWVLGDFGLCTFDEKPSISDKNDRIGSRHYIAPEVHLSQEFSEKSETYALGKTIHCLLAGHKVPIPGPHHPSDRISQLEYTSLPYHPKISFVDNLIQNATTSDPQKRISIEGMVDELKFILKHNSDDDKQNDLSDTVRDNMKALGHQNRTKWSEGQELQKIKENLEGINNGITMDLNEYVEQLPKIDGVSINVNSAAITMETFKEKYSANYDITDPFHSGDYQRTTGIVVQTGNIYDSQYLIAGIGIIQISKDRRFLIGVVCYMNNKDIKYHYTWESTYVVGSNTAEEASQIEELKTKLQSKFEEAIPEFTGFIQKPTNKDSV